MPEAFVLIATEAGSEADVLKDLRRVEGVEEVFAVSGVYDIVVRLKADTVDQLNQIIRMRIHKLYNVRSTLTMFVAEEK